MTENLVASLGGKKKSSSKKRRLEALEENFSKKLKEALGQAIPGPGSTGGVKRQNIVTQPVSSLINPIEKQQTFAQPASKVNEAFQPLSSNLRNGPVAQALKIEASGESAGSNPIHTLLCRIAATDPDKSDYQQDSSVRQNLGNRPFLVLANHSSSKPKGPALTVGPNSIMSNAARKKKRLSPLQGNISVQAVEELHRLWKGYTDDLCATSDSFGTVFKGLILHGCKLKVVEARNPMHVGLEGVVFEMTSACLHMASLRKVSGMGEDSQLENNARISHVPKQGSAFTCILPGKKEDRLVTIIGANLK